TRNESYYELGLSTVDDELRIQDPESDPFTRGFPCLSHVSVTLQDNRVHLTATYRSQDFTAKGYGNLVGLGRLGQFLANESEHELGELVCVATCATLPSLGGRGQLQVLVGKSETEISRYFD